MNANTIPLQEVLPWSPNVPRNILVSDSIETDGSFVLSTMASHLFSSSSSVPSPFSSGLSRGPNRQQKRSSRKALWLSCGGSTEREVASTLKKMGCDAGAAYLRKNNNNKDPSSSGLRIRSLAVEISNQILAKEGEFDGESYLTSVYNDIKAWVDASDDRAPGETEGETPDSGADADADASWIILDDATALASILGDTLVFCFVESLINRLGRRPAVSRCGLVVRCSGDVDQMLHAVRSNEGRDDRSGWVGAGGMARKQATSDALHRTLVPWERALEESVDALVDVLPLRSGFSREAHGRLVFSETPNGRGWRDRSSGGNSHGASASSSASASVVSGPAKAKTAGKNWNKLIFNYCLQDTGARAIRLRAG